MLSSGGGKYEGKVERCLVGGLATQIGVCTHLHVVLGSQGAPTLIPTFFHEKVFMGTSSTPLRLLVVFLPPHPLVSQRGHTQNNCLEQHFFFHLKSLPLTEHILCTRSCTGTFPHLILAKSYNCSLSTIILALHCSFIFGLFFRLD